MAEEPGNGGHRKQAVLGIEVVGTNRGSLKDTIIEFNECQSFCSVCIKSDLSPYLRDNPTKTITSRRAVSLQTKIISCYKKTKTDARVWEVGWVERRLPLLHHQ
jgi:hypothetical protein